jgi:phosphotransferase system  glucose/maltose/N-acetylglucosamine-specific IIC component
MSEERADKAKQKIWNLSWVVVGLLVAVLAAMLLAFMTCRKRQQEPSRGRLDSRPRIKACEVVARNSGILRDRITLHSAA